ncbi:MAG TPA: NADH-quinone oxidoreductase subunit F [Nitrospiraceae bacterium]|nr:NADH-quinone oxidoreductase subunit F [Nitrospiraceae bacterium]
MFEPVLLKNINTPDSFKIDSYLKNGGYRSLKKALEMSPDSIIQMVKDSGLRGRGGAGFPTGLKWSFIPKDPTIPKYLCCNADEGEPGTFKDRAIIEKDPHQLLEGMAIACYAIGAANAYIYIRGEFALGGDRLEDAIREAVSKGYLGKNMPGSNFSLNIYVHRGAGAYICGEETALLESIEGRRALPRIKPPFPAQVGLFGKPTVINNVETLACVPHIIERGAAWFASIGPAKSPGPKLFGVSGHVNKPGLYELPMGTPLREIVYNHAGGIKNGRSLKAVIPGGVSAPMLTEKDLDITMDFESLAAKGSMLGSGAVIVMDDNTCIVKSALIIHEFFHHESCGKCTPCREGLDWIVKVMRRVEGGEGKEGDVDLLLKLCGDVFGRTFCPLGDGAVMALRAAINNFRSEFEYHVSNKRCMVNGRGKVNR